MQPIDISKNLHGSCIAVLELLPSTVERLVTVHRRLVTGTPMVVVVLKLVIVALSV